MKTRQIRESYLEERFQRPERYLMNIRGNIEFYYNKFFLSARDSMYLDYGENAKMSKDKPDF